MTAGHKGLYTDTADSVVAYSRLHITPLDPELLEVVIPPATRPLARNISFHSVQTFPEKRYGFVEIPTEAAEKIKKKLHGAILRGSKVRIEQARADNMPRPSSDADAAEQTAKKERKQREKKKRKRDAEEITGIELEAGRKVKRGWTVSEDELKSRKKEKSKDKSSRSKEEKKERKEKKKKEPKSKYSDGPECLMKIKLPPNKADLADTVEDPSAKKKRRSGKSRELVVHEFEKTTKFPTFLKSTEAPSQSTKTREFVDGKGWVDEAGNVVEKVSSTRPVAGPPITSTPKKRIVPVDDDDETSSSGSSSEGEPDEVDGEQDGKSAPSNTYDHSRLSVVSPKSALKSDASRPKSSGSAKGLTIQIPPPPATPMATKIHPLEALYKRPKPEDGAEIPPDDAQPFSFFGTEDIEDEEDATGPTNQPPLTPFTQQDYEGRLVRSAAPTPDTAHPNRKRIFWAGGDKEDDIEEEEEEEEPIEGIDEEMGDADVTFAEANNGTKDSSLIPATSDFQGWFWEHRGDLNRSWKRRRKLAGKEKRYRENRARADRAI